MIGRKGKRRRGRYFHDMQDACRHIVAAAGERAEQILTLRVKMYIVQGSSATQHTSFKSANRPSWNIQSVLNIHMRSCKGVQCTGEPEQNGGPRTFGSLHGTAWRLEDSSTW